MTVSRRAPLALLAACVFAAICTEVLPVGLLPEVGSGLHVSTGSAGLLVSIYAVLVAVMSVPIAAVVERWPRRIVLGFLLGAYALSNVLFAAAPDYAVALVARVVGGVAHAGFFAVSVAAAVSLVEPARSGRAVAAVMVGNALALVLGVPLGTVLGTALGWRWAFVVLAVATAGLAAAVVAVLPADGGSRAEHRTPVLTAVRRPVLLVVTAVIVLLALGHFTLYTYVSALALHDGIARPDVGLVLFGYGCGGVLGLAAAGVVVARRPEWAFAVDGVLMGLSLLLAALVHSPAALIVVLVVWGAAFGALPTLSQTVTLRSAPDAADTASALVNAATNVGIAGGAFLGSRLLGPLAVPDLGWVGAGLAAASLAVYAPRLRRATAPPGTPRPAAAEPRP